MGIFLHTLNHLQIAYNTQGKVNTMYIVAGCWKFKIYFLELSEIFYFLNNSDPQFAEPVDVKPMDMKGLLCLCGPVILGHAEKGENVQILLVRLDEKYSLFFLYVVIFGNFV